MALILNIDTSSYNCSVALSSNDKIISFAENNSRNHTQVLLPLIKKVLDGFGYGVKDLSAIAVNIGPGSYTGLRVGLATAKGLCYSFGLPFIAINGLMALADEAIRQTFGKQGVYVALIDNYRGGWYYGAFDELLNSVLPINSTKTLDDIFFHIHNKQIYLCQNINELKYDSSVYDNVALLTGVPLNAKLLVSIAAANAKKNNTTNILTAQPMYINSVFSYG